MVKRRFFEVFSTPNSFLAGLGIVLLGFDLMYYLRFLSRFNGYK